MRSDRVPESPRERRESERSQPPPERDRSSLEGSGQDSGAADSVERGTSLPDRSGGVEMAMDGGGGGGGGNLATDDSVSRALEALKAESEKSKEERAEQERRNAEAEAEKEKLRAMARRG